VIKPLLALNQLESYDIAAKVEGGGLTGKTRETHALALTQILTLCDSTGHVGAVRLGIARCLCALDANARPTLRRLGLLTRDSRVVERKKPGQRKARRKFQWYVQGLGGV